MNRKNLLPLTLLFVWVLTVVAVPNCPLSAATAGTPHDIRQDSTFRDDGTLWKINEYAVWEDQKGLARRTVKDENGYEIFSLYKPDCDSTQTVITGTYIELRDYKDGQLRASEHYTPAKKGVHLTAAAFPPFFIFVS